MSGARRVFTIILCVGAFLETRGLALTLNRSALEQELASAPLVAKVRIDAVTDAPEFTDPHFRAEAVVEKILSADATLPGRVTPDRITIVGPGGTRDSITVGYAGMPLPLVGERYVAHLAVTASGDYEIRGYSQGFVPESGVATQRMYSRNRTDGTDGQGTGPYLRWPEDAFPVPFAMVLEDFYGHRDIAEAIERAFQHWRDVPGTRFDVAPMGCVIGVRDGNDGINSIHFVRDHWSFGSSAIAVTRNYYYADGARAGIILDTDILLNAVDYEFATDGSPTKQDVENVITHEVGHFWGLGHEQVGDPFDFESTMYAFASAGETLKRTLAPNDIAGIRAAYPGQGNKSAWVPLANLCVLDRGPSCAAVPYRGGPRPSPWAMVGWLTLWITALLLSGRFLARALR